MILINGELLPSDQTAVALERLPNIIDTAFALPPLDPLLVAEACSRLAEQISGGAYQQVLEQLIEGGLVTREQISDALSFFSREALLQKLETELGPVRRQTEDGRTVLRTPLGVLFHIAAGNAEALPAYSVAEGLLAGNVNLLKLPSADDGLSVQMLWELVKLEPRLAPFIAVFDTPSSDLSTLERLASLSDGIVVWGSDEAVQAARRLAPANVRLIEWGHKLSFAYATPDGADEPALQALARQIAETRQLLCSSCQGVFLDTDSMDAVRSLCKRFLPILDRAMQEASPAGLAETARQTLVRYTQTLGGIPAGTARFEGKACFLSASENQRLEPSLMPGHCWVKPLPRRDIVKVLRPNRGTLQTAGLLCAEGDAGMLSTLLIRAGVVRVTAGGEMSRMKRGMAHDGEYPLLRYTRIAEVERIDRDACYGRL